MSFVHGTLLLAGLAASTAAALCYIHGERRRRAMLSSFAARELVPQLAGSVSARKRLFKRSLLIAALFLLFVALARPQYGFHWQEVRRKGIDLLFLLDTSKSMLAQDVVPNRLERSTLGIADFVQKLDGDRVGLVPFSGQAFLLCPLTLDYDAFFQSLAQVDVNFIPLGGTNIAAAIAEAQKTLSSSGNKKIVILVSDGEDLSGDALDAAKKAAEDGIIIYTVGVGTAAGELIPVKDGTASFVKDEKGQVVKSRLDEKMLQEMAAATGGAYLPLGAHAEGLEQIYREHLQLLPQTEQAERMSRMPIERFTWPLFAAFVLLIVEFLMNDRKEGQSKKKKLTLSRILFRSQRAACFIGVLFIATAAAEAAPHEAQKAYDKGDYAQALEGYAKEAEKKPENALLRFNLGTAAYRAKKYEQAAESFNSALKTDELSLQEKAYYNRGNALFRAGEESLNANEQATIKYWEEALHSFESASRLKPDDEDAAYNYRFVKKKLDELKKQQQNQQQQKHADQKGEEQQQPEQQQAGAQSPEKQEPKKDEEKQETRQEAPPAGEKQDGKASQEPVKKEESEQQKANGQKEERNEDRAESQARAQRKEGEMSKEEAEALLNAMRGEEAEVRIIPEDEMQKPGDEQPLRDW